MQPILQYSDIFRISRGFAQFQAEIGDNELFR